jgi:hypothetical protein
MHLSEEIKDRSGYQNPSMNSVWVRLIRFVALTFSNAPFSDIRNWKFFYSPDVTNESCEPKISQQNIPSGNSSSRILDHNQFDKHLTFSSHTLHCCACTQTSNDPSLSSDSASQLIKLREQRMIPIFISFTIRNHFKSYEFPLVLDPPPQTRHSRHHRSITSSNYIKSHPQPYLVISQEDPKKNDH